MKKTFNKMSKHGPVWAVFTALVVVVGSTAPVRGQVRATDADTLVTANDYVAYAIAHNPRLAAARARAVASGEVLDQRGALPKPKLGLGYYIETPETRVGPQRAVVTLSQKLPFFGKRGLRSDIAGSDAHIAGAEYRRELIYLVYSVKTAFHEYVRLCGVGRVLEEEKKVLLRMEEVARVKYASGQVGQQDVLTAQLELSQVEDELTTNRRDVVTVTSRLIGLLNLGPLSELAPPVAPPATESPFDNDPERLYELAVLHRPELHAAAVEMERTDQARALAKKEYYPDVTVGVQYVNVGKLDIDVPDNGKDIWQVVAVVDLPIWFGRIGAGVREAEALQASARSEQTQAATLVRSQIRDAVERVNAAAERVKLYEAVIVPQAEQSFLSAESGYGAGKVDFLTYLDSQRVLLSIREKVHGVVADLGKERAYMERVLGTGVAYEDRGD